MTRVGPSPPRSRPGLYMALFYPRLSNLSTFSSVLALGVRVRFLEEERQHWAELSQEASLPSLGSLPEPRVSFLTAAPHRTDVYGVHAGQWCAGCTREVYLGRSSRAGYSRTGQGSRYTWSRPPASLLVNVLDPLWTTFGTSSEPASELASQ